MTVFAKIFEQIFDSSIADDYVVRHVFMDLLVLADRDGVVDMTIQAIARRTNVPVEIVTHCIELLASPDNRSRSDLEGGARIVRLDSHRDWGWQIVNYDHYRQIRDEEGRKAYFRDYKRTYRHGKKNSCPQVSTLSTQMSTPVLDSPTMSTKAEVDVDIEEQKQIPSPKPRKRVSEVKHSTDPRHIACKAEIFEYYRDFNEGADPDWDGREGRALGMFLSANPKLTAEGIQKLLHHRARSQVNHSERPALWIGKLSSFRRGPLNEFGKPLNGSNGHVKISAAELRSQRRDATFAEAERILAAEKSSAVG